LDEISAILAEQVQLQSAGPTEMSVAGLTNRTHRLGKAPASKYVLMQMLSPLMMLSPVRTPARLHREDLQLRLDNLRIYHRPPETSATIFDVVSQHPVVMIVVTSRHQRMTMRA
jgi:hypothetical protein